MTLEEAVKAMGALQRFGIKSGNDQMIELMRRLGDPQECYPAVHVTGTKGKGSTTVLAAAILQAHGLKVGSYFSPYVYDIRERIQVSGQMISREDFARLATRVFEVVEAMKADVLVSVTEFEVKTAIGFLYFAEQKVDIAVIEVGIGGRLDSTNIVQPVSCIITNIGLDHTEILGDTHAKIAFEKAGIIKAHTPVVTACDEPSALEVIRNTARARKAPVLMVGEGAAGEIQLDDLADGAFKIRTPENSYGGLKLGLPGHFQRTNACCALGAAEVALKAFGIPSRLEAVQQGLLTAFLPGRFHIVHRSPIVILDGTHNATSAEALANEIRAIPHDRLTLVLGMAYGHPPEDVLAHLAPLASRIIATQPPARALPAAVLAEAIQRLGYEVEVEESPLFAARSAMNSASKEDVVLVTGSFYTIGAVRPEELLQDQA